MKNIFIIVAFFLLFSNLISSVGITIWGIVLNNYCDDYLNYKSLKYPSRYMDVDTLVFKKLQNYTNLENSPPGKFILHGNLKNTSELVKIVIIREEYIDKTKDKYAVYKSKLTRDYFLKDAPSGYYTRQNRSFFLGMYLKLSLLPILILVGYLFMEYKKMKI